MALAEQAEFDEADASPGVRAEKVGVSLGAASLLDLPFVATLVRRGAREGVFTNLFLETPYFVGLVTTLALAATVGRIWLPDGRAYGARLRVLRLRGERAGFLMLTEGVPGASNRELYMCAVQRRYRGRGLGRLLVREAMRELGPDRSLTAYCLPAARAMKRLLVTLGWEASGTLRPHIPNVVPPELFSYRQTSLS